MGFDIFNIFGNSEKKSLIPSRDPMAMGGSIFISEHMNSLIPDREKDILNQFLNGNLPDFIRDFVPITISKGSDTITYLVMPDYLSIGSNEDYVRMPMNPLTAQKIADKFDCTLPTPKMVYQIWEQSINKLSPLPWGPPYDSDMIKTHRIGTHNSRIQAQLVGKNPFKLTSGHKKDVVLTNKLSPKNIVQKVAIYGWIQLNGKPIQPLNPRDHEITYEDYSHGIRLIANDVVLNGKPKRITDVFSNAKQALLISDEIPLIFTRY